MIHQRTLNALEFGKITAYLADLCVSSQGRAKALAVAPLKSRAEAEAAFRLYEETSIWLDQNQTSIAPYSITAFPDVSGILEAASMENGRKSVLDLDAFWALRETLSLAKNLRLSICQPQAAKLWPTLLELAEAIPFPENIASALNRCISENGYLRDEGSPELLRIRTEIRSLHQNCLRRVKDYARQYNIEHYLQDDFMTLAQDRYVLPLKANFKGRLQGVIHDWSQTGETIYFEPMFLVEVNNRLAQLKREEHEEERKIIDFLVSLLKTALPETGAAINLLAETDFLNAKRLMAAYLDCHAVSFSAAEGGIELLSARHPLLAMTRQASAFDAKIQPAKPLDIILKPGERVLVITGGNAGGKTVCLKTTGLIAAMTMSGLPATAAKGSHLPWFDRVDAFIGDEQSLDDNVSTFTAQIDHLARAWKHLDSNGLALLDEFGAGTDPAEGAALAQAVLDGLHEKQCFTLCATHFPALKSYALTKPGVAAASMLFNPETHKPMFKLAYGQVGSSEALLVAKEHGLPESILLRARHYLLQDGEDASALITRLNSLAAEREQEIDSLQKEKKKNENILAAQKSKLEKERERLKTEISAKISALMKAWKEEKTSAKQAMRELSQARASLIDVNPAKESAILPEAGSLNVGQEVFHAGFNKRGTITGLDERRKRARLDMNGVNLWADWKDLRQTGQTVKKEPAPRLNTDFQTAALSLDVRGFRSDEALLEVERFLDKAILAGFSEVEIIHGRGTGALRRELHNFLHAFPAISSFSIAPEDRGGDGMTIIRLK